MKLTKACLCLGSSRRGNPPARRTRRGTATSGLKGGISLKRSRNHGRNTMQSDWAMKSGGPPRLTLTCLMLVLEGLVKRVLLGESNAAR